MINETVHVGRGHVPAVREAADGTGEQVCTKSVVPARDCRVAALLAMTRKGNPVCHCEASAHTGCGNLKESM